MTMMWCTETSSLPMVITNSDITNMNVNVLYVHAQNLDFSASMWLSAELVLVNFL